MNCDDDGDKPQFSGSEPEREPREEAAVLRARGVNRTASPSGALPMGGAVIKTSPLAVDAADGSILEWFGQLRDTYGSRLLLLLFASQHLLKGVVQQFQASAVMWLLMEYSVTGPQMQIYMSVASSSWALKPIIGAVSDTLPLFGYRKAPYVVLTSMIGVASAAWIGFTTRDTISILGCVLALLGMSLQASTCDLLTEATYSERLQERPQYGPDLITYIWGGIGVGNMIAISFVGCLITTLGARAVFLACLFPSAAIIIPTLMNYFEEVPLTREMIERSRAAFARQSEVLMLCVLMTFLTTFLAIVGAVSVSHEVQFASALLVLLILVPSFHIVLRPEIARVNCFFVLQSAFSLGIGGATFYFYTDQPDQYPEGPHFTAWFFASTMGLVASVMSLIGLATYTVYMKNWNYHSLMLFTNILSTLLSLMDVVLFLRLNVAWGIPDALFVLGSSTTTVVIKQWQWMPAVVIMSQLCPVGMEATMFALLAGCANVGSQISDYFGAYALQVLGVHPSGAVGETHQFDNLWKASCLATMLPAITIILIPFLIPQAKQTEKLLLGDVSSATAGSPLNRWRERQMAAARLAGQRNGSPHAS